MPNNTWSITNQKDSPNFGVHGFLGASLHRHDSLNHWPVTQFSLFSSEIGLPGYDVAQSPRFLITWAVFLARTTPILSLLIHINTSVVRENHRENLKDFEATSQDPGAKAIQKF